MIPLRTDISQQITFQTYMSKASIVGVSYEPLAQHQALEGWFMEWGRLKAGKVEGMHDFEIRQLSISKAEPHRLNAFHLHSKRIQDEIWCVLQGKLKVWLVDVRADSSSVGVKCHYLLSSDAPARLTIPSGVAHGYKAGSDGALLLYAMNDQFDPADPNEGRLPWDYFGAELWEADRG